MLYFSKIDLKTASVKDIKIEIDILKFLLQPGNLLHADSVDIIRFDIDALEKVVSNIATIKAAIELHKQNETK
jgi:hypothetical protein